MSSLEWQPISEVALLARVAQGETRMSQAQLHLWNAVQIRPEKWLQSPYGDLGGGFWAVGLGGQTVIWYNDREEGFNRSRYSTHGAIEDYWCNNDELELTVQYLMNALELGADLVRLLDKKPAVVSP